MSERRARTVMLVSARRAGDWSGISLGLSQQDAVRSSYGSCVAVPASVLDAIDRAGRWVAAEQVRAARLAEIAQRHEEAATTGPPALREFHQHAADASRQIETRHVLSAGMHATYLARLRASVRRIIGASSPDQASTPSRYGLADVRDGRAGWGQPGQRLGIRDRLTNLPNQYLFAEQLAVAVEANVARWRDRREWRRLAIFLIGLDNVEEVNDRFGREVGDRLLVALARRLGERVPGRFVARMGNDEFVVLVEDVADSDGVTALADVILAAICEPARVNDHEVTVSASIGVAVSGTAQMDPTEIMRSAVTSLAWAKTDGGGRWVVFDRDRDDKETARGALAAALPEAIGRDEMYLEYQPVVSLADGVLTGVEALVRWQHPTLGRLGPDEFVPVAEESGAILSLGRAVLAQACAEAVRWSQITSSPPYVSVNVAARQLQDQDLVNVVAAVLDETGLPASQLQLEITEGAIVRPDGRSLDALHLLVDLGVAVVIDDFGTGYSSLSYLRRLPVHTIKIDRSFVADLYPPDGVADEVTVEILSAIISLAHVLGLAVTAEGVESAAQAQWLQSMGCDSAQGWYFGRPVGPAKIEETIAAAGQA
jgi:diguanylate cyclase (GGDEF)-like protein